MSGTTSYVVKNESQLNADIAAIDAASVTAPLGTNYTISLTASFSLSANITTIALASGTSLAITGAKSGALGPSVSLTGGGLRRGFVVSSGDVTITDVNVSNTAAIGGNGGNGAQPGGGGAGLGGGLFVGAGASVLLNAVNFTSDAAKGGRGGTKTRSGVGAGGTSEPGGFGNGGAGGVAGGFGGGGGAGATGGFGAGGNGGGGLAAGGDVFVQQGGQLTYGAGSAGAGQLSAGASGGQAYGSGVFIQGNGTIVLGNVSVAGVIADQSGSGGTGANAGAGAVAVQGAATLTAANTYTGGTQITGSLTLLAPGAAGSGEITFASGSLVIGAGDAPGNLIGGFGIGDIIDLEGVGTATGYGLSANNTLSVLGTSAGTLTLHLDPAVNYANDAFVVLPDGGTGTSIGVTQSRFYVASETDLNAALSKIDLAGSNVAPSTSYTITFTGGFTLATDLDAINLAAGDTLTIDGAGFTMDGGGAYRGLLAYNGAVTVENLTIANAVASGGAGGAGTEPGGGGAGLGGGLFVAAGAAVTLNDVQFVDDAAVGGVGGVFSGSGYGGGGGLGGAGGAGNGRAGGGGGVGTGAVGGSYGTPDNGAAGILLGAGAGNGGTGSGASGGGADGGGGGVSGTYSGSGRDPRSFPGQSGAGGDSSNANFGGGGGSGELAGFGGGGSAYNGAANGNPNPYSGDGGFGGGSAAGGAPGFGGGVSGGGGGGGLGAGGGVFVQQGGSLTIGGGALSGGSVTGGAGSNGGGNGSAYGAGIFFQGSNQLNLAPADGQALTLADVVADQLGAAGAAGSATIAMNGAGTVVLSAMNTYTGGTTINSGTLSLQSPGAAGAGNITFGYGAFATLIVGAGDVPSNTIDFFLPGQTIDLQGIGVANSASLGPSDVLSITGGTVPVQLTLDPAQIFTGETFAVTSDLHGGTLLTPVTIGNDHLPFISGGAADGDDHDAFAPLAAVTVADLDTSQIETATLRLSSTSNGTLSNLGGGSYNSTTGIYTVAGTAAAVTAALDGLVFTPTIHEVPPGGSVQTVFDLSVTDGIMTAHTPFNVSVAAVNDPPAVTGSGAQYYAYWNVPMNPFTGIAVVDPDAGANETVTLTVTSGLSGPPGDSNGTLSLASPVQGVSLTETGGGVYSLTTASPAAVTAALDAVQFTPATANPSLGWTIADLNISVSDGIAAPVSGGSVTVDSGLPIITGTAANQQVVDTAKIDPFSTVQITDSAYFPSETVTILIVEPDLTTVTDALGSLSGAGLAKVAVGTYSLPTGTPASVTAAVDALTFKPPVVPVGKSVTTTFEISVFDGVTTHNDYSTTVITSAPAAAAMAFLAPSGPATGSGGGGLGAGPAPAVKGVTSRDLASTRADLLPAAVNTIGATFDQALYSGEANSSAASALATPHDIFALLPALDQNARSSEAGNL